MLNSQDSVISGLRLKLTNGFANGNITLDGESFKQGAYRIRAYTKWMTNFEPEYFYDRTINVGNAIDNKVNTFISYRSSGRRGGPIKLNANIIYKSPSSEPYADKKVTWQLMRNGDAIGKGKGSTDANGNLLVELPENDLETINASQLVTAIDMGDRQFVNNTFPLKGSITNFDVQFFPESGQLTNGIRTRIAFKAINVKGLGVDIKGTVTDDKGTEVATFTSTHLGMGVFALTPESDKVYTANVVYPNGSKATFKLPRTQNMGIGLAVYNTDPENLNVKIAANDVFLQRKQNKSFYLVAQSGGVIYYAASIALKDLSYSATVPKAKFPTGIVQLTLFFIGRLRLMPAPGFYTA